MYKVSLDTMESDQSNLQSSVKQQNREPFRSLYSTTINKEKAEALSRLNNPKLSKGERMHLVGSQRPDELDQLVDIGSKGYEAFDYTKMEDTSFYIASGLGKNEVKLPFARYFSPAVTKKLQLWSILEEIRSIVALKEFFEFMRDSQDDLHEERRGTAYDLTGVIVPGHMTNKGIRLSKALRAACKPENSKFKLILERLVILMSQADQVVFQSSFDEKTSELYRTAYEDQRISEASMINGHGMIGGTQINYFAHEKSNLEALKTRGDLHPDSLDDPPRLSNLYFFQANTKNSFFPGRFNIASTRLSCSAEEFGVLTFSARHPHFSSAIACVDETLLDDVQMPLIPNTAGVPRLHGKEYFNGKIHIVRYARQDQMRARPKEIHPEWLEEGMAAPHFGGLGPMKEWKMLLYIKSNMEELQQRRASGNSEDLANVICNYFEWTDEITGERLCPSLEVARRALELEGKGYEGWKKLHSCYLWTDCGNRKYGERDPNSIDEKKKVTVAKWKAAKKAGLEHKQCSAMTKGGNGPRCKILTFNPNYCTVHGKETSGSKGELHSNGGGWDSA